MILSCNNHNWWEKWTKWTSKFWYAESKCLCCMWQIDNWDIEEVKRISKQHLTEKAEMLSVSQYEDHFSIFLKQDLVLQYHVEDYDLKDLLLSPRAQRSTDIMYYQCCCSCYNSLTKGKKKKAEILPNFLLLMDLPLVTFQKRCERISWLHGHDSFIIS